MRQYLAILAAGLILAASACKNTAAAEEVSRDTLPTERHDLMPRVYSTTGAHLSHMMGYPADEAKYHNVQAVYTEGAIWLRNDFTVRSLDDLSELLHEFVHHLQHIGALKVACPQEAERAAYDAQAAFLEASGSSLEKPNEFTRIWLTTCPSEFE